MSIFTSHITKTLAVPHDDGQFITIRKLAPKHLKAARKAAQQESFDEMRAMGSEGAAVIRAIVEANRAGQPAVSSAETPETPSATRADPLALYDIGTLCKDGITSWTYAEKKCEDAIAQIDEDTQLWLAGEILRLSSPSLYQTPAEAEDARKNA